MLPYILYMDPMGQMDGGMFNGSHDLYSHKRGWEGSVHLKTKKTVLTMDLMVRMECNQPDINGTHVYIKLVD